MNLQSSTQRLLPSNASLATLFRPPGRQRSDSRAVGRELDGMLQRERLPEWRREPAEVGDWRKEGPELQMEAWDGLRHGGRNGIYLFLLTLGWANHMQVREFGESDDIWVTRAAEDLEFVMGDMVAKLRAQPLIAGATRKRKTVTQKLNFKSKKFKV